MRFKHSIIALVAALLLSGAGAASVTAQRGRQDEATARRAIEGTFQHLRAGNYAALYDELPRASQRRISRERFINGLQRAHGMYQLERIEIGALGVAGDLAAADTVIYGSIRQPIAGEGRILVRQYLVRENGRWRVVTQDTATIRRLLAANPEIARRFPWREARAQMRREGRWVDMSQALNQMRRRAGI